MQTTRIEWVKNPAGTKGKSWNPVRGLCPGVYSECAEFCYARKLYKRYGWNPEIRLDEEELNCRMPKKPSRIFVGSTFDLSFAREEWLLAILDKARFHPKHTFIFLTKAPGALYMDHSFPANCWLGMTVYGSSGPNAIIEQSRFDDFKKLQVPNLKFISFEPLLRDALGDEDLKGIDWVIIGERTAPHFRADWYWVKNIVDKAIKVNCKVFMKNNLSIWDNKIQQIPEGK